MNVLLVAPELKYNIDTPPMPIGLLSIATELKTNNHSVTVFDRTVNKERLNSVYNKYKPDIVGVSIISTHVLKDAIKVSKFFHSKNVKIIWGGIFPSQMPDVFLKNEYIDMISIGEGEKTFEELLDAVEHDLPLENIAGLAFKKGSKIIINPDRAFLTPEEIPVIDYSLLNINDYITDYGDFFGNKVLWVSTTRGCPYNCSFCYNKAYNHSKVRRRNPADYLSEIGSLLNDNKIDAVFFADEVWCFSSIDMRKRCNEIIDSGLKFNWGCFITPGFLTRDDYQYMYDCGCRLIYFGLESGSDQTLNRIRKPLKIDTAFVEIKNCSEIGILPFVSFIIGFPNETAQQLKLSADLIKKVSYYGRTFCYFFLPYVGSDLYNELLKSRKVKKITDISDFNTRFPFSTLTNTDDRNFSDVPLKDLVLIYSYSLLWNFFNKKDNRNESFFRAIIKGTRGFLSSCRVRKINFSAIVNILYFIYTYAIALIRVCLYRKTARKYGLRIK